LVTLLTHTVLQILTAAFTALIHKGFGPLISRIG